MRSIRRRSRPILKRRPKQIAAQKPHARRFHSRADQYPALVVSGTGEVRIAWSDAEALAFAALYVADQMYAEGIPAAMAEELAKSMTLRAAC